MWFPESKKILILSFLLAVADVSLAVPVTPDQAAKIYLQNCAICHGRNGDGNTGSRFGLRPPPRDFTTAGAAAELTRERMISSVTTGRPDTAMAGWGRQLSAAEIEGVVDYILDNFMSLAPGEEELAATTPGLERGRQIFEEHCRVCHGDRGNSSSWIGSILSPSPRDFTSPQSQRLMTRDRMLIAVTSGRSGTAMMPFSDRLSEKEIENVVDYILETFIKGSLAANESRGESATGNAPERQIALVPRVNMGAPFPDGLKGDYARGRDFYLHNCSTCHGSKGDGLGPRAYFINPKPVGFINPDSRETLNRPRLFRMIATGKAGTVMPAWSKVLGPQEIADVAEFVFQEFIQPRVGDNRSQIKADISTAALDGEEVADEIPSTVEVAVGSNSETRFEQGRDIYNYHCYFCHGYAGDARTLTSTYVSPAPRNFVATRPTDLSRERMIESVTHGRMNTAMAGFKEVLTASEIELAVDFIRQAFMGGQKRNTRYHTSGNGWPDHDRFRIAFPFARGDIPLDKTVAELSPEQQAGRELFMSSCITCHDRARVQQDDVEWGARAISYPRHGYSHQQPDAVSSATPYSAHEVGPVVDNLTERERWGETLFRDNCAFCHAADGTGKNWIGSFLEPHPRDLTSAEAMAGMTNDYLQQVIHDGLEGTSMPAWRAVLNDKEIEAVASYVMRVFVPD